MPFVQGYCEEETNHFYIYIYIHTHAHGRTHARAHTRARTHTHEGADKKMKYEMVSFFRSEY